jgi:hypothetical protein
MRNKKDLMNLTDRLGQIYKNILNHKNAQRNPEKEKLPLFVDFYRISATGFSTTAKACRNCILHRQALFLLSFRFNRNCCRIS